MVYKLVDKKSDSSGIATLKIEQLAENLPKPIIKNPKVEKYIHQLKIILGLLI